MPSCYFLAVCASSSVDQQTNNVSLFNLVEQISIRPEATPAPGGMVPVEMHAYWQCDEGEPEFEARFVMVAASTGLETSSPAHKYRPLAGRVRSRSLGLPLPPVLGSYLLRIDWRPHEDEAWRREALSWPIRLQWFERRPRVTH